MSIPLLTWSCVVALILVVLLLRVVYNYGYCSRTQHHLIEIGTEREELFMPGDRVGYQDEYDDYDCGKDF